MQTKTKLNVFLSLLLTLTCTACKDTHTETAAPPPSKPPVQGELVLQAELEEIPGSFPPNELYNYAYVMKYKVLQVVSGTYAEKEILVGHYNPRIAREEIKDAVDSLVGGNVKSFTVGDVHYLVLDRLDTKWTGAVEDDFFKDKSPRYWALWADKVK